MRIVFIIFSSLRLLVDFFCVIYAKIFWPDEKGRLPLVDDDVLLKPAHEIAQGIRKGTIKSEDVVRAYVKRIKQVNPLINAIVDERYEGAIEEAKTIDERVARELEGNLEDGQPLIEDLPFLGVPFTCKDSVRIKGLKITGGIYAFRDQLAEVDSDVVSNLCRAGAIPMAITNVPCGLMWFTSENRVFGRTNNPYDLSRIPGGSSGGESALISAAGSLIGIGSDVAGSIRMPAHCCGIWGHKTTANVIKYKGLLARVSDEEESHFVALGPMTRYASDLLPMLKAMAGDEVSKLPRIDEKVDFGQTKLFYMLDDMDPLKTRTADKTKAAILSVAHHFEKNFQTEIKPVTFAEFSMTNSMLLACIQATEGIPFATQLTGLASRSEVLAMLVSEAFKSIFNKSEFTRHAIIFALLETFTPDVRSDFVQRNLKLRDELKEEIKKMLGPNGVLILPTVPEGAFKHGTTLFKARNLNYCSIFNLIGLPSTQCPIGLGVDGMPLGIQVAANPFNDHLTIAVAQEVDRLFGGWSAPFAST